MTDRRGSSESNPRSARLDAGRVAHFRGLLERQAHGQAGAVQELEKLRPDLEDGYCLFNLYEKWQQAFSYRPGRVAALAPILNLARKLESWQTDDTLSMYGEPEWAELVKMSGPVDGVTFYSCSSCGAEHPRMMMSGFLDLTDWLCRGCGAVYFASCYREEPLPACACGSGYSPPSSSCNQCGASTIKPARSISGFEYFESHRFTREA